ncbi:hypothetical protein FB45DRAFT_125421 [Roridomyces roridus]|uniref:GDP-fucose protein O-fucosyltransferase 2 n=1 Tax=Roridomyces roridus TaxID=1738132 RepID=A0AAD7FIM3_9AGAR|nr:hypothetical protein FB45DRAFT_125421 [Roridomyces roridus]
MKKLFPLPTKHRIGLSVTFVQVVLVVWFLNSSFWRERDPRLAESYPSQLLLNGPPTAAFRDNLRPEVKYVTSWPANGWSNQVIEFMNLIYLAQMTERVPIIPRFRPVHLDPSLPHMDFGDVFDVPRLRRATGIPILEWRQVKDLKSEIIEELGCWDIQNKTWDYGSEYLDPPVDLKLDISYTRARDWVRLASHAEDAPSLLLWPLAALVSFTPRAIQLPTFPAAEPSRIHGTSHPPDTHLFCCNSMYFGLEALEETDMHPAWQSVGRHMYFTESIQGIGEAYIRRAFGLGEGEVVPPYIAIHARRGDFSVWCEIWGVPSTECFAPISAYAQRVQEMQTYIYESRGIRVTHVIATSDEEDSGWWAGVSALGWKRADHKSERTVQVYGAWYPMFIDAVIQSSALGFIGTATSTVSILARRRVGEHHGVSEMVQWGWEGADEH